MNNREVVTAFVAGKSKATGSNLRVVGNDLISYRTIVARRLANGEIGVNPVKYSQSTGRQKSHLFAALRSAGYEATENTIDVEVHNPGRWGGLGFAWGPEYSTHDFVCYRRA